MRGTQLELLSTKPFIPDLSVYDYILVAFSGGKDSLACVLHLLNLSLVDEMAGQKPALGYIGNRIELWHHEVDGREGSDLFDWPCTTSYVSRVGDVLGLPVFFSWRQGGIEREMLRSDQRTAPVSWENPDGTIGQAGGTDGPLGRRMRFPQVSKNLQRRWCTPVAKIDVMERAINNQPRFRGRRTLVVTGERAEESPNRRHYAQFERYRGDRDGPRIQRRIDHWRPIHTWGESEVWKTIEDWDLNPHPAYRIGFGRLSCACCIFGSPNQWATIARLMPERFARIVRYERMFAYTIHVNESIAERAARGRPYDYDPETAREALSKAWDGPVFVADWQLPSGAFGDASGPG